MDSHLFLHPAGFREGNPSLRRLVGYPSSYHNGAGNLSFADGHIEAHRWQDSRTRPPLVPNRNIVLSVEGLPSPDNLDVQWPHARTFQKGD
jgi:prepilin-type processing-associated H-X9-DG protein